MSMNPKYLIRPSDFELFELYRDDIRYQARYISNYLENAPEPYPHFTYENLVNNYDFFPIDEDEIEKYSLLSNQKWEYEKWRCTNDGYGGLKFKKETFDEYLKMTENGTKISNN